MIITKTFYPDCQKLSPALWQLPEPPVQIQVQGQMSAFSLLDRLPEQGLAIVGSRSSPEASKRFLRQLVGRLKGFPLIVLSGLAKGIDQVAHESALEVGLPTIAIMGTPLCQTYPRDHKHLRDQILDHGGLIVSEFQSSQGCRPYHFLLRNRIIAGWSQATVVIAAGKPSGALNTAFWAKEMNKDLYAVPSFPGDPALLGNQVLLDRDHAFSLWGAHSLGSTWIELATISATKKIK